MKSPRFGTPGRRFFSTSEANSSISETNAHRQPRGRHATVAASIPLHTLPYRMAALLSGFPSSISEMGTHGIPSLSYTTSGTPF